MSSRTGVMHHCITVVSNNHEWLLEIWQEAAKIFGELALTSIAAAQTGMEFSFMIGTDGAPEQSPESAHGDRRRTEFFTWLNARWPERPANDESFVDAVETAFGREDFPAHIGNIFSTKFSSNP